MRKIVEISKGETTVMTMELVYDVLSLIGQGRHIGLHFGIFAKQKQGKKSIFSLLGHQK